MVEVWTHAMPRRRIAQVAFAAVVAITTVSATFVARAGAAAVPAAAAKVTDANVERSASGQLTISWTTRKRAPVTEVLWGKQPTEITTPLVDVPSGADEVVVDDPNPGSRSYFALVTGDDERTIVAERALPLEGDPNFRDVGGYSTKDGRTIKWGLIYRSGSLDELSDADLAYLDSTGIKLVCDLRSPGEIEIEPDRLPVGAEAVNIPLVDESVDPTTIREAILAGDVTPLGEPGELLVDGNKKFITDFRDELSKMMERVMDRRYQPANIHCTAGKDRAGLAAAIVLLTLGVPEKTVMDDYLASNRYREEQNAETVATLEGILDAAEVEVVRSLLEVRPEYLQAALDTMKDEYGSIDAYLRKGLGISDKERARFQNQMLETRP